jgi:hypothetical protein
MRFLDALERDRHAELDHGYVAPTEDEKRAAREATLAAAGFPVGSRVRMLVDGNAGVPLHVRPLQGEEGTVVMNLSMPADRIPVRFQGKMLHALTSDVIEVIA